MYLTAVISMKRQGLVAATGRRDAGWELQLLGERGNKAAVRSLSNIGVASLQCPEAFIMALWDAVNIL